jgi:hypothetical protein
MSDSTDKPESTETPLLPRNHPAVEGREDLPEGWQGYSPEILHALDE